MIMINLFETFDPSINNYFQNTTNLFTFVRMAITFQC